MFLLDTNVISELKKAKAGRANHAVIRWVASVPSRSMYISAITVMELEMGTLLLERRDALQGALLRSWLNGQVLPAYSGRILAVDVQVAVRCGALHVPDRRSDRDALIAATAFVHGMTVATRNTSDFQATGVSLLNPWQP